MQACQGGHRSYGQNDEVAEPFNALLTEAEAGFLAARDSFCKDGMGKTG